MKYLSILTLLFSFLAIADNETILNDFDNRLKSIPNILNKDSAGLAQKFVDDAKAAKSSCEGERKFDCEFSLDNRISIVQPRLDEYKPKADHNAKVDEARLADSKGYNKCKPKIDLINSLEASKKEKVVELQSVQSQASIKRIQREIEKILQQVDDTNGFLKKNNCGNFIYW